MSSKEQMQKKAESRERGGTSRIVSADRPAAEPERQPAAALSHLPAESTIRPLRQASLLQLQKQIGNTQIQRLLVQRDGGFFDDIWEGIHQGTRAVVNSVNWGANALASGAANLGPTLAQALTPTVKHYSLKPDVILSAAVESKVAAIADAYHRRTTKDIVVTSGTRSAAEQAQAMYDKLELGDDIVKLYGSKKRVKQIKKAYDDGKAAAKSAPEIKADMTAVINQQIADGAYISKHLRAGAVDIRSRDMSATEKTAFRESVAEVGGMSVILETKPPHFHLQMR